MRPLLAAVALVGPCVADDKAAPTRDTPEIDWRLAKLAHAKPAKIGVLTYYPNTGGGYTFTEGQQIVFYSLPFLPATSLQLAVLVEQKDVPGLVWESRTIATIGKSQMPFGGQTFFRGEMKKTAPEGTSLREDTPIATWTRDSPTGRFRLSIMDVDSETRMKLKSIIPLLEHAGHTR
jgi:hypothetical protein